MEVDGINKMEKEVKKYEPIDPLKVQIYENVIIIILILIEFYLISPNDIITKTISWILIIGSILVSISTLGLIYSDLIVAELHPIIRIFKNKILLNYPKLGGTEIKINKNDVVSIERDNINKIKIIKIKFRNIKKLTDNIKFSLNQNNLLIVLRNYYYLKQNGVKIKFSKLLSKNLNDAKEIHIQILKINEKKFGFHYCFWESFYWKKEGRFKFKKIQNMEAPDLFKNLRKALL